MPSFPRSETPNIVLRAMRPSDLDMVVQNENLSYQQPWSKRVFLDCLRSGYECWVLATRDRVVAHGVLSAAVGEAHVLTLCVHRDFRRAGYGRRMLRHLLDKVRRRKGYSQEQSLHHYSLVHVVLSPRQLRMHWVVSKMIIKPNG